jgi:ubiquinone/menaquinone biosynthesis C-methylase UbiE
MPESVNFDRASEYYDLTRGFPPGVDRQVGAFIAHDAGLKTTDRVLEIGIGTGRIALPLAPHVGSISGIDISTQMMDRLRQKQNGEVIYLAQGDALALPFPNASFDAIMITHVLHLVADVPGVLHELARVLKPSGKLLHCRGHHPDVGRIDLLAQAAFVGGRDNSERHQHVNAQFGTLGWRKTGESMTEYTFDSIPRVFLERIENRVWSSSWSKTDAEIAGMAARIRAAIDEHFGGDADTPLETKGGFRMEIFTPPPVA